MNKKISSLFICLFLVFGNVNIYAQTILQPICNTNEIVAAFFNGIKNTKQEAKDSLDYLKQFYGETAPNGERIRYELLYNETLGIFDDLIEVFEQRMGELGDESGELLRNRYELFFDTVNGDGPWYEEALNTISGFADMSVSFLDLVRLKIQEFLFSSMSSSMIEVTYIEHKTRLDNWMLEGKKLLFIAHSQGNLFANAAYDYAKSKVGEESVSVIHIAPASFKTNGHHVLADKDYVIAGLRLIVGNVPEITNSVPDYSDRPAGVNGGTDRLGHGFVEIYINPNLEISRFIESYIGIALDSLKSPPNKAQSGFFTATLTWDGYGDVDLHTYEPDGYWIYFANRRGLAGYLDVDNTQSDGPEHYYASCDATTLKEGTYTIKVANYRGATGRTATVQIASYQDGVLGTKSVTLGGVTGSSPAYHMFDVLVSKDNSTNQYSVSLQ